jgi:hypothetical protein
MKPVRSIRAWKWQLSAANCFALLRERYLEIDTIPKPRGLGSEGPLSGLYVPDMSRTCPTFVSVLSRFCAASFCSPEGENILDSALSPIDKAFERYTAELLRVIRPPDEKSGGTWHGVPYTLGEVRASGCRSRD